MTFAMYLRSKGSDEQILPINNFWRRNMQKHTQETVMSSIEFESVDVSDIGTRLCAKELLQSSGKCAHELDVPLKKNDARNSLTKTICFDVVLSGNGYDYLGP
jgi:hypothetical protein